MLLLNYNDFDECFLKLNKGIIEEPDKYLEFKNWKQYYLPFTIIETNKCDCNIDLGLLGYTETKIKMLINTYIDFEKYEEFKQRLYTCKGTSLTLYFKNVKPKKGSQGNNGPCIISMVFTKQYRKDKKYSEVNIYYRTTEINRRFYADLCLFNLIMRELSNEVVDVKKFRIILPKAFFHTRTVLFNLDVFHANMDIDNYITQEIKKHQQKFNENRVIHYKSCERIRKKLFGELKYDIVNLNNLYISDGGLHI